MSSTSTDASTDVCWAGGRRIGPVGTAWRVLLVLFLTERVFLAGDPPSWWHYPLGLLGFPAVLVVGQAAYGRWRPRPASSSTGPASSWIGPGGVAIVGTAVLLAFLQPVTRPALGLTIALLLLLSAVKGDPDCEGTVLGNWLLRRTDRIACPNSLVDVLERQLRRRRLGTTGTPSTPPDTYDHP